MDYIVSCAFTVDVVLPTVFLNLHQDYIIRMMQNI